MLFLFNFNVLCSGHNYEASAFEVVQIWRDEQGPDASLEKLESVLQAIGREDILKNFKHLTNSSYGTHDRLLVTEIHRNGDTKHTNRYVEGKNDILIDSSCEKSVEVSSSFDILYCYFSIIFSQLQ